MRHSLPIIRGRSEPGLMVTYQISSNVDPPAISESWSGIAHDPEITLRTHMLAISTNAAVRLPRAGHILDFFIALGMVAEVLFGEYFSSRPVQARRGNYSLVAVRCHVRHTGWLKAYLV